MNLFSWSKAKPREETKPKAQQDAPQASVANPPDSDVAQTPDELIKSLQGIHAAIEEFDRNPCPPPVSAQDASARVDPVAEKEKLRDRSLFKALLSGLYDAVLVFDTRGFVIESNKRAEQFFGYGESEMWNLPCDKLLSAVNARILTKIRTYAEAGRFMVVNAMCARKDGSTFPAEIAISRINLLNDGDLIFSIRNLERREKARERHEMELDALHYAGAATVVCRADGFVGFVNSAFVKLLRYADSKEVENRFIGDFCTSYEAANALMKTPSAHGTWLGQLELRTADGQKLMTLATAALSGRKKDAPANVVVTLLPLPTAII